MRITIIPVLLFSIAISACSSSPHIRSVETVIAPRDAIMLAADALNKFAIMVQSKKAKLKI